MLAASPRRRPAAPGGDTLGHLAQLGKHSTVLLVGNVLSRGLNFVLLPVYTAVLAPAEFGYWESLLLLATLVGTAAAHGITAALMWTLKTGGAVQRGELAGEQRDRAISAAVGWAMLAVTVVCGLGCLLAEPLAKLTIRQHQYAFVVVLLLVGQALRVVTYPAEGVLKLRFQSVPIVTMSFGEFLVQGLGTGLALLVFDWGLIGMAWASLLGAVVRFALGWMYLPEMRRPRLDLALVRPMVRYGLPLMPGTVAALVLSLSDRWFLIRFGMADESGIYGYGDRWARIVEYVLVTPLVGMWPAVFFNIAREPDAKQQFARIATLFAGVAGTLGFVLTMLGPVLTRTFDTSKEGAFAGAAGPIGVLVVGYVFFGLNEVARVGFQVTGRTRRTALAMVLAAALNLVLNALLIPPFGAFGAAWATMISYGAAVGFSLWLTRRIYPQRWEGGRLLHVVVVLVGGAWAVQLLAPPDDTTAGMLVRLLAMVLVPAALLATGFLRPDEWASLRALVRRRLGRFVG